MFRLLKNIIKGKGREPEQINFSLLDEWFNKKLKETTLREEIDDVFDTIHLALKNIKQSVTVLSTTLVQDIPAEQKIVIEQHVQKYVSLITHLAKQMTPHETRDSEAIINYRETLAAALQELKSEKEFAVIQRFYAKEADEIQETIAMLDEAHESLSDIIKRENGLVFIADIKKKIATVEKKHRKKLELQSQIERENFKKDDAQTYKLKLETDADNLKTSEEYDKYDKILSRKIYLEKEKERVSSEVSAIFHPLVPLFRLYDYKELGADRALARAYAEDTTKAFFNDGQLWILSTLESIAGKLPELEQDEKKRLKYRQSIIAITEDSLNQIVSKNKAVDDGLREIRHQLSSDITARKLEDVKYKLSHAEQQISHFDAAIAQHQHDIEELYIEKDLRSLERDLASFVKVKIV